MCSVVGAIGSQLSCGFVLEGLSRLEYRGYDSAGFACINQVGGEIAYQKVIGGLENLTAALAQAPIDGLVTIGHTRWSTHGVSTQENAHPHFDTHKKIAVVHNGIIENYRIIRAQLQQAGHTFYSQTDTEVIARLLEQLLYEHKNLHNAVTALVGQLEGAYAFVAILQDYPDQMVLVRKRSPLCIGVGAYCMYVASDVVAFADKTDTVVFMPDESFALLFAHEIKLYQFDGCPIVPYAQKIVADSALLVEKHGYQHYMLKEIYEQKKVIQDTVQFLKLLGDSVWEYVGVSQAFVQKMSGLSLIGCGTSWHAARIAQFYFEQICNIPTGVHLASEFRYKQFFPDASSLYTFISQSGETADTLEALRMVAQQNLPTLAITNVSSSTMVREADGFLLTQAGREIAVASTKAFSTQLTVLYWFAHRIAYARGTILADELEQSEQDLLLVAHLLETSLLEYKQQISQSLAHRYAQYNKAIFLGRHMSYPFAMEAALKLKEIAYIFSQCYPAGELKHGPLALVDAHTPIFVFSYDDPVIYQKLVSNTQEAKARGGHIVAFAFEGQEELCEIADCLFVFPRVKPLLGPLLMTGVMQYLVYAIATDLGLPVDKPRNLAKSVTVE